MLQAEVIINSLTRLLTNSQLNQSIGGTGDADLPATIGISFGYFQLPTENVAERDFGDYFGFSLSLNKQNDSLDDPCVFLIIAFCVKRTVAVLNNFPNPPPFRVDSLFQFRRFTGAAIRALSGAHGSVLFKLKVLSAPGRLESLIEPTWKTRCQQVNNRSAVTHCSNQSN